jgi:hypothetical protein
VEEEEEEEEEEEDEEEDEEDDEDEEEEEGDEDEAAPGPALLSNADIFCTTSTAIIPTLSLTSSSPTMLFMRLDVRVLSYFDNIGVLWCILWCIVRNQICNEGRCVLLKHRCHI